MGDDVRVVRAVYPAYGGLGGPRVAAEIIRQLGPTGDEEIDGRVRSMAGDVNDAWRDMDPAAVHHEKVWAMRRLFEVKAAERPLLLVIDDIHRSGDQTLQMLGELMTRLAEVPAMLVLAGRPDTGEWQSKMPRDTT